MVTWFQQDPSRDSARSARSSSTWLCTQRALAASGGGAPPRMGSNSPTRRVQSSKMGQMGCFFSKADAFDLHISAGRGVFQKIEG